MTRDECAELCQPRTDFCVRRWRCNDFIGCILRFSCIIRVLERCERTEGRSCSCAKWRRIACACRGRGEAGGAGRSREVARSCPEPPERCAFDVAQCDARRIVGCCRLPPGAGGTCAALRGCGSDASEACLREFQLRCALAGGSFSVVTGAQGCEDELGCS